jgi:hypothetical protein
MQGDISPWKEKCQRSFSLFFAMIVFSFGVPNPRNYETRRSGCDLTSLYYISESFFAFFY